MNKFLRLTFFALAVVASSGSVATAQDTSQGDFAEQIMKDGEIISSSVAFDRISGADITEDRLLRIALEQHSLLIRFERQFFRCEQLWEQVEGGAENLLRKWRLASFSCDQ